MLGKLKRRLFADYTESKKMRNTDMLNELTVNSVLEIIKNYRMTC